ncbi:MAG: Rrf2 family transcriptional regulator [Clostridiales bacterium]|nr:Rrf2 family transcriptional regulator [Clostridiales bacterium]
MKINTRFTVATHILALIALNDANPATSEMMAMSVGGHPVAIRQVMGFLKKAGLIETQNGVPGGRLAKSQEEITLYEIYQAVQKTEDFALFDFHPKPNPLCPVGKNMKEAMAGPLFAAQTAMEDTLKKYSLKDITSSIFESVRREQEYCGESDCLNE